MAVATRPPKFKADDWSFKHNDWGYTFEVYFVVDSQGIPKGMTRAEYEMMAASHLARVLTGNFEISAGSE